MRKLLLIFNDTAFPGEEWKMRNSTFLPNILFPFPSKICSSTKVIFYLTSEAKNIVIFKSQNISNKSKSAIFHSEEKKYILAKKLKLHFNKNPCLKKSILLVVITECISF